MFYTYFLQFVEILYMLKKIRHWDGVFVLTFLRLFIISQLVNKKANVIKNKILSFK